MLAPEQQPLKPSTPLHPETAPKTLVSRPQRRWRFQSHACTHKQRRWRFQTSVLPVVQSHRRATRPGPGCGARGRPWGATDINMPGAAGMEGAGGTGGHGRASRRGPGRGAGGRQRGLAGQHTDTPTDWRPPRGLRGLAGLRADAPSEARGADGERAGRPCGGRRSVGATSNNSRRGRRAGGQASRRPEICRGNKQHEAARPHRGPGGSRIRPLGGSQRLFQRICVPAAPRRSQASTTRAAMPASADLPHVRGSYCFLMPTSPSILRTPS